jgi:hypothetical protein
MHALCLPIGSKHLRHRLRRGCSLRGSINPALASTITSNEKRQLRAIIKHGDLTDVGFLQEAFKTKIKSNDDGQGDGRVFDIPSGTCLPAAEISSIAGYAGDIGKQGVADGPDNTTSAWSSQVHNGDTGWISAVFAPPEARCATELGVTQGNY